MIDLSKEIFNLNYREIEVPLRSLFPNLNLDSIEIRFKHLKKTNPHETIYLVARALSEGGYDLVLNEQGFWNPEFSKFTGHANQCAPILGLVLTALGFECSYLECFRVRDHITRTGMIDPSQANEEKDLKKKEQWARLRRIPYSILEVNIKGINYYISGKHLSAKEDYVKALLKPECYNEFIGIFRHQDDSTKSGIYINAIQPQNNLQKANFNKQVLWRKQTSQEEFPEYFLTFLRMKLIR